MNDFNSGNKLAVLVNGLVKSQTDSYVFNCLSCFPTRITFHLLKSFSGPITE